MREPPLGCVHDGAVTASGNESMSGSPVATVVAEMQERLDALPESAKNRRLFLSTYQRTTRAVGKAIQDGAFEDADWVKRWDIAFAEYYLRAHDADLSGDTTAVPRPWRLAFNAPASLPALGHVLLGVNAHVNYDLPQALLDVMPPEEFDDRAVLDRRRRDHERIDAVLGSRVSAEQDELRAEETLLDRFLSPLNRASSRRFLREARHKVWHNVGELHRARLRGADAYRDRLRDLEVLSAARIADLIRPGQVLLRLAVTGFGVVVPPE
jgi:hypothetical protein